MLKRWWKTVDNSERKCCDSCAYFFGNLCGYTGDYTYGGDYACRYFCNETPNDYDYEP